MTTLYPIHHILIIDDEILGTSLCFYSNEKYIDNISSHFVKNMLVLDIQDYLYKTNTKFYEDVINYIIHNIGYYDGPNIYCYNKFISLHFNITDKSIMFKLI